MPTAYRGNANVLYKIDGTGPAVLFVHGTGGTSENNWDHLVPELSKEFKLIRPHYAGSAGTVDDGGVLDSVELAEQAVAAALDAGANTFDVVGFSLGAAISTIIAAKHPEKVRKLVLIGPFLSNSDPRQALQFRLWRELAESDPYTLSRLIILTGFSPHYVTSIGAQGVDNIIDAFKAGIDWSGMQRQLDLEIAIDVTDFAAEVVAQTLVLGFSHDHIVPAAHAKVVADTIANSRYLELDCGHLGQFERPDEIIALLRNHLRPDLSSSVF